MACWAMPTLCHPVFRTISQWRAEPCQQFATQWHQFSVSWNCFCHSWAILANIEHFSHTVDVFHAFSVRSQAVVELTRRWMERDQYLTFWLAKILWMYLNESLNIYAIFLKSCLTFELEYISFFLSFCLSVWLAGCLSFRTKFSGQHSIPYQAPISWNQLHAFVRHSSCVSSVKSSLTFLFS